MNKRFLVESRTLGSGSFTGVSKVVLLTIFFVLASSPGVISQKHITLRQETWAGYFNQTKLTKRSGVWLDLHFRWTDRFVGQKTFAIARAAYIHYIGEEVRLMAGYAYANRYNRSGVSRVPEHRPWQQVQWLQRKKSFQLTQAFRVEQRLRQRVVNGELENDYVFNWRIRYNFSVMLPFGWGDRPSPQTPFCLLSNETMVNAGKVVTEYFDQNRSFFGIGYRFNENLNAHLGYLFVFQQDASAAHYLHIHAIRFFVIHNFDFSVQE